MLNEIRRAMCETLIDLVIKIWPREHADDKRIRAIFASTLAEHLRRLDD